MLRFVFNNKGFVFIEVIFIALLVAFTSSLIVRGLKTAIMVNQTSAVKTAAIYIANAQMSEIEEYIDKNKSLPSSYNFLDEGDLIYDDFLGIKESVIFTIETDMKPSALGSKLCEVTIKVSWKIGDSESAKNDDENYEQITRDVAIVP